MGLFIDSFWRGSLSAHDQADGQRRRHPQARQCAKRGNSLQVRLYAGIDPVTGKSNYLAETVKGTDKAAHKHAKRSPDQVASSGRRTTRAKHLGLALLRHRRMAPDRRHQDTTRRGYVGYLRRSIRPALGTVSFGKLGARMLETFSGERRRCPMRRPSCIAHNAEDDHDCKKRECKPYKCKDILGAASARIDCSQFSLNTATRNGGPIAILGGPDDHLPHRRRSKRCQKGTVTLYRTDVNGQYVHELRRDPGTGLRRLTGTAPR